MYRHILVPVDGTKLSFDTAAQAVDLASEVKAQITFLYATPDLSATSDGALLISVSPDKFVQRAKGETDTILAKVAALAKAKGVAHETVSAVSDHPYIAIIKTAEDKGCDLIFMASHRERGVKGLLRGSQTEKVVMNSPVAVCVAAVERD